MPHLNVINYGERGGANTPFLQYPIFTINTPSLLLMHVHMSNNAVLTQIQGHEDVNGWVLVAGIQNSSDRFEIWACRTSALPTFSPISLSFDIINDVQTWLTSVEGVDVDVLAQDAIVQWDTGVLNSPAAGVPATLVINNSFAPFYDQESMTMVSSVLNLSNNPTTYTPKVGYIEAIPTTTDIRSGATHYLENDDLNPDMSAIGVTGGTFYTIAMEITDGISRITSFDNPIFDGEIRNELTIAKFVPDITTIELQNDKNPNFYHNTVITDGVGDGPYVYNSDAVLGVITPRQVCSFDSLNYPIHHIHVSNADETDFKEILINPAVGWDVVDVSEIPSSGTSSVFSSLSNAVIDIVTSLSQSTGVTFLDGLTANEWTDQQKITLFGFDTTPNINGEHIITVTATTISIPIEVLIEVDQIGVIVRGGLQDKGQILYDTNGGAATIMGTGIVISPPDTIVNWLYLNPTDGFAYPGSTAIGPPVSGSDSRIFKLTPTTGVGVND